jgi:hypothetical protein
VVAGFGNLAIMKHMTNFGRIKNDVNFVIVPVETAPWFPFGLSVDGVRSIAGMEKEKVEFEGNTILIYNHSLNYLFEELPNKFSNTIKNIPARFFNTLVGVRNKEGIFVGKETEGFLARGPYKRIKPGKWLVNFKYEVEKDKNANFKITAVCQKRIGVLSSKEVSLVSQNESLSVELEFEVVKDCKVEFTTYVYGSNQSNIKFTGIDLIKL